MMGPITISTTTAKVSEFMTAVTDLGVDMLPRVQLC